MLGASPTSMRLGEFLDVAFEEGDHPWIEQNPRGMLVVATIRRLRLPLPCQPRALPRTPKFSARRL